MGLESGATEHKPAAGSTEMQPSFSKFYRLYAEFYRVCAESLDHAKRGPRTLVSESDRGPIGERHGARSRAVSGLPRELDAGLLEGAADVLDRSRAQRPPFGFELGDRRGRDVRVLGELAIRPTEEGAGGFALRGSQPEERTGAPPNVLEIGASRRRKRSFAL